MSRINLLFFVFISLFACAVQGKVYGHNKVYEHNEAPINEAPVPDSAQKAVKPLTIIYSANVVCQGTSVTLKGEHRFGTLSNQKFEWDINGTVSQGDSIIFTPTLQETKVILSLYDDMGFLASDTIYIYLTSKPQTSIKHDTICYGDEAIISVTGGNYWYWSTYQISSEINIRPGSTTSYIVYSSEYPINRVDYINECYATDTVWVVVHYGGITAINGDTVVCSGSEYTYSVRNAAIIEWWDGNTQNPRNIFISGDTTISYTGINVDGCKIEGSLRIGIVEMSQGEIVVRSSVGEITEQFCIGDTVLLSLETSAQNFRWFNGDTTLETGFIANVPFTVYCVISTEGSEINCNVKLEKPIDVTECLSMFFPSGFKPDGVTSTYAPVGIINPSKKYEFSIYNHAGERVFETNDLTVRWDGKIKGENLPPGVYVYLYRETIERFTFEKRGTITLVR